MFSRPAFALPCVEVMDTIHIRLFVLCFRSQDYS